jgi:hypothetical protein
VSPVEGVCGAFEVFGCLGQLVGINDSFTGNGFDFRIEGFVELGNGGYVWFVWFNFLCSSLMARFAGLFNVQELFVIDSIVFFNRIGYKNLYDHHC